MRWTPFRARLKNSLRSNRPRIRLIWNVEEDPSAIQPSTLRTAQPLLQHVDWGSSRLASNERHHVEFDRDADDDRSCSAPSKSSVRAPSQPKPRLTSPEQLSEWSTQQRLLVTGKGCFGEIYGRPARQRPGRGRPSLRSLELASIF